MAFAVKNSLFVRNLSPQVSETILRDAFGACGDEIEHVAFKAFPNQNHQFFAQIDFKTSHGVAEGSKLNGTKILGTAIVTGVIDPLTTMATQPKQSGEPIVAGEKEMVGAQGVQAEYFRLQKEAADDQRFRTIHVAGLPDNVKDEGLKKMCGHFGQVLTCRIDKDPFGKVFGLVEFKEKGPAHVCKAQREFFVHGRVLTFSESKTMVDVVSFTEKNVHFQDTVFDALNLRTAMAQQGVINMKLNAVREAAKELGMVKEDAAPERQEEVEREEGGDANDGQLAIVRHSHSEKREQKRRRKEKKHKTNKKKRKLASWEEAIGVGEGLDNDLDGKKAKKEKKARKRKEKGKSEQHGESRSCSRSESNSESRSRSGSPLVKMHSLENAVFAGREGVPLSLHDELANQKRAEAEAAASDDDDESSEESRPVEIAEDDELCLVGNTERVVLGEGSSSSSDSSDSEDKKPANDVLDDNYELDLEVMGAKKLRLTHKPIPVAVLIRAGLLKRKGRGFQPGPVNMELDSGANLEADGLEEVEGDAFTKSPANSSPLFGASPAPALEVDDAGADSEGLDADNFEADLEVVAAQRSGAARVSMRPHARPRKRAPPPEDLEANVPKADLEVVIGGSEQNVSAQDADAFEADLVVVGAQRRAGPPMARRDAAKPLVPPAGRRAPLQRTVSMEIDVEAAAPKRVRVRPKPTISLGMVDDASEESDNLEFEDDLSFVQSPLQSPLPMKSPATASPAPTASPATIPVGMTQTGVEDVESGFSSSSSDSVSDVESLN